MPALVTASQASFPTAEFPHLVGDERQRRPLASVGEPGRLCDADARPAHLFRRGTLSETGGSWLRGIVARLAASWPASRRVTAAAGLGLLMALPLSGARVHAWRIAAAAPVLADGNGSGSSGGSAPQGSAPSSSAPHGSAPQGSAPHGSTSACTAPQSSAPSGSAPSGSAPSGSAPSNSAPSGSAPSNSASSPAPCTSATPYPAPATGAPAPPKSPAGTAVKVPLHTAGAKIVDANGQEVRFTGVTWFGFETANFAPHGLWARNWQDMLDQMKAAGFNTIRLPFSNQLLDDPGAMATGIDYTLNPDLKGLHGLALMDKIVDGAGQRGLKVILDQHRPTSAGQSELWYTDQVPESRWLGDWTMLARHYAGDAAVIGADLHNEPHGTATWGGGNVKTDWRLAAERGGDAILSITPNWLI